MRNRQQCGGASSRRWWMLAPFMALAVIVTACGGSGSDSDGDGAKEPEPLSATLEIITTNIQTAVSGGEFAAAEAGQSLVVGDQVKTDDTGFAELVYHDGSWQRIENNATLTVEALTESDAAATVESSVDLGRTWNRVRELTEPEDAYELETPVATATVRGTAFATECPDADTCTFWIVEGTVEIAPLTGDPITADAPAIVVVRRNQPVEPPQVVAPDVLRADPWIKKNLELDGERFDETEDGGGDGDEQGAGSADATADELRNASIVGTYDGVRTVVANNFSPEVDNGYGPPGSVKNRVYEFRENCDADPCTLELVIDGGTPGTLTFDGTAYVIESVESIDCVDDVTGQVTTAGSSQNISKLVLTPSEPVRNDSGWVISRIDGESVLRNEVLSPVAGTQDCRWTTTDGQPYMRSATVELTRRG